MSTLVNIKNLSRLHTELENIDSEIILLVVDTNVYNIYRQEFDFMNLKGKTVHVWKSLDGERTKCFEELRHAMEFFISKGVSRKSHLVTIGGGACSDFGGLIASLLLRGISWSVMPTTLLSMIDASVGGKVAINSEHGKNLVGAFHLPTKVYICNKFLETLPEDEVASGLGEYVKYCMLNADINNSSQKYEDVNQEIFSCAKYKETIVEEDFKESGKRQILNFGHTLGHAIEVIYEIPHGTAILWGMVVLFKVLDNEKGMGELASIVKRLGIDLTESPWKNKTFPVLDIIEYVKKDKKVISKNEINIVNIKEVGNPIIETMKISELENKLREKEDELKRFVL